LGTGGFRACRRHLQISAQYLQSGMRMRLISGMRKSGRLPFGRRGC
jgi:hypothetical protein